MTGSPLGPPCAASRNWWSGAACRRKCEPASTTKSQAKSVAVPACARNELLVKVTPPFQTSKSEKLPPLAQKPNQAAGQDANPDNSSQDWHPDPRVVKRLVCKKGLPWQTPFFEKNEQDRALVLFVPSFT